MTDFITLEDWLQKACAGDAARQAAGETLLKLAQAARETSRMVARGPMDDVVAGVSRQERPAKFDEKAGELFMSALKGAPVAAIARERGMLLEGSAGAPVALAIDVLNGVQNIMANIPTGSFFSFLPAAEDDAFAQPGSAQVCGGFFMYGPRTMLVFSFGEGTVVANMDPETGVFHITSEDRRLPREAAREYAANASNYRFWDSAIRTYVNDMIDGADGPREADYNMRWASSLPAETVRILNRGGIFLYPGDSRPGHRHGRMRLLFHAFPVALVVEQAGGMATDGEQRILDKVPQARDQRTPLIFGSPSEVERVRRYYELPVGGSRSPLFSRRGLFRF